MITLDDAKAKVTQLVTAPDPAAALSFADELAEVFTAQDAINAQLETIGKELTEARRIAQELFLRQTTTEKPADDAPKTLTLEELARKMQDEKKGVKNA